VPTMLLSLLAFCYWQRCWRKPSYSVILPSWREYLFSLDLTKNSTISAARLNTWAMF
jgi:hypothetical protein